MTGGEPLQVIENPDPGSLDLPVEKRFVNSFLTFSTGVFPGALLYSAASFFPMLSPPP